MESSNVERWHAFARSGDLTRLDDLLADDAVFHSPVVHTPQQGKELTKLYLSGAFHVLSKAGFRYVREVVGESDAFFEFTAEIDGIHLNGVDIIHWNADGKIDDFKVMIRPLKAINLLHRMMGEMLASLKPDGESSAP